MPRADSIGAPSTGHGSPSRTSAASMTPSAVKSRPATRSMTCRPVWSAPVTQRVPSTTRGSTTNRMPLGCFAPSTPGPMYPLASNGFRAKSSSVKGSSSGRLELGLESLLVDLPTTGHADGQGLAGAVRVAHHHDDVLEGVVGLPRPVVAREPLVEHGDQGGDGRGVRGVLDVGRRRVECSRGRAAPAPARPRRWRRSRSWCTARRCPRRTPPSPGTPRSPTHPSRRTSPPRSRSRGRAARRS